MLSVRCAAGDRLQPRPQAGRDAVACRIQNRRPSKVMVRGLRVQMPLRRLSSKWGRPSSSTAHKVAGRGASDMLRQRGLPCDGFCV